MRIGRLRSALPRPHTARARVDLDFSSARMQVLTILALAGPPTLPDGFSANVKLKQTNTGFAPRQEYTYYYDWVHQREKLAYSAPKVITSLFIYHGRGAPHDECYNNNTCASIYTWGPKFPCLATNTSNTLERFWSWLMDDEFTHQKATFLGHDASASCDRWQHNSKPFYPASYNETACVADETPARPVYMHWNTQPPNASDAEFEDKVFDAYQPQTPTASVFQPPPSCQWGPPERIFERLPSGATDRLRSARLA